MVGPVPAPTQPFELYLLKMSNDSDDTKSGTTVSRSASRCRRAQAEIDQIVALSECAKDVVYYRKKLRGIDPNFIDANF